MSICFFDCNYDEQYRCTYKIKEETICVEIEYDIGKEIEVNGVRIYSANTEYKTRDVLIVDSVKHKHYLLKNAYYMGSSSVFGTYDERVSVSFESGTYFEAETSEQLMKLLPRPKTNKIRVYSTDIVDSIQETSVKMVTADTEVKVTMSKDCAERKIELNTNNIKQIILADECKCDGNRLNINFHIDGYIEIDLMKKVGSEDIKGYIYEIMIFMQLYRPGKFPIERVTVEIGGIFYVYFTSLRIPKYTDKPVICSVDLDLLEFMKQCYVNIPYRNSKDYIRNIPYIIMNTYRGIEDNFLMFYRFIECYYKRKKVGNAFMSKCMKEHCREPEIVENMEKVVREIIRLRNHYVHSGYFIKNSRLKITFKSDKSKNYEIDADANYIYNKTKLLYLMVIDIIFKDMLGVDSYIYKKTI